ncbi:MAG: hypothetical protein IJK64_06465 [Clostridia bacterium]|nr:hypothetical protein [Clostridia bacterium]
MSVYVVDYENVQANGLSKIEKLSDKDVVIIFYSVNQSNISIEVVKKIQITNAKVLFKEANVRIEETNKSFHDALDMQLATYVGYIIGKYQEKDTKHFIVSDDRGFSFVCEYWRNRGFRMEQIKCIEESLAPPLENEPILPAYEKEVCELIEDVDIAKAVAEIIRDYKTKNDINDYLQKKYKSKGQKYFKIIKPLISDKQESALPAYEKEVREVIEDESTAKEVAKIIRKYKTKHGINARLGKEYGAKGQEYYAAIKPLLKDKK